MNSAADRKWQRVKVDVRVKLWLDPAGEGSAMVVRSYEMGPGGMSVYAPEQIELGAPVVVGFTLSSNRICQTQAVVGPASAKALRFAAVVGNKRGFRYGLEFVGLSDAERVELARYLETSGEQLGGPVADAASV